MRLLLVGASAAVSGQVRDRAAARGLRVVHTVRLGRPSWAIVATVAQRREALNRFRLPADRVLHVPAIAAPDLLPEERLARGFARMVELGPCRPLVSPAGVWLARRALPWIGTALERVLGAEAETAARRVAERVVRSAAKEAAEVTDPEEARRTAERRARRRAERAAAKAPKAGAVAPRDEERIP